MNLFSKPGKEELLAKAILKDRAHDVRTLLAEGVDLRRVIEKNPTLIAQAVRRHAQLSFDLCLRTGLVDLSSRATLTIIKTGLLKGKTPLEGNGTGHFWTWFPILSAAGAAFDGVDEEGRNFMHLLLKPYQGNAVEHPDGPGVICNVVSRLIAEDLPRRMTAEDLSRMLSSKDRAGDTPLHYVLRARFTDSNTVEMVRAFIKYGADISVKNGAGLTPLDIAYQRQISSTIRALESPVAPPPVVVSVTEKPAIQETPAPPETRQWKKTGDDEVCYIRELADQGYRLTDIFNFALRERVSLVFNTRTNAEHSPRAKSFDVLADKTPLEKAHAEYAAQGGKIGVEAIYAPPLQKPRALK